VWKNDNFFKYLSELKAEAIEQKQDKQIVLVDEETKNDYIFNVNPHGAKRYEWFLSNNEYTIKIGNWRVPQSVPSAIVEIRSETLWSHGYQKSVNKIVHLLERQGAFICMVKPSRVDLCVDILLPEKIWSPDLIHYKVTRAAYTASHAVYDSLTGISIGKGAIIARLYDKPLEIKQKKDKLWMYDVWGLKKVPDNTKIIRIEFQLRREIIKSTEIDDVFQLFEKVQNLWGYCTQKWLKFQSQPGKHNTQRKTFEWWEVVQNGFLGFQDPNPSVRLTACSADRRQLIYQMYGLFTSYCAIGRGIEKPPHEPVHIGKVLREIFEGLNVDGKNTQTVTKDVEKKQGKYLRTKASNEEVKNERLEVGYPDLPYSPRLNKNEPSP